MSYGQDESVRFYPKEDSIYRVLVRAGCYQGRGAETHWSESVLYTGTDLTDARVAYYDSAPKDKDEIPGNYARKTRLEQINGDDDIEILLGE